ncbi:MAG: translation initiation factor IF-3 [Candidatus Lambdaproteobacteria bacterium]|nr:translation initiation factor IF-3 [Candidatus Lambdaproteobacteria bacterium]
MIAVEFGGLKVDPLHTYRANSTSAGRAPRELDFVAVQAQLGHAPLASTETASLATGVNARRQALDACDAGRLRPLPVCPASDGKLAIETGSFFSRQVRPLRPLTGQGPAVPARPCLPAPCPAREQRIANVKRYGSKREDPTRINRLIVAKQVRVIDPENEQLGILELEDALARAEQFGLDLVEVAGTADPPVCRIMDYGQYKYQKSKRQHEAKKNQKIIQLKEIKLRPRTEEHDFQFKLKHALEFIEDGNKVKVSVFFRGREMAHQELGRRLLDKFSELSSEAAIIETTPRMEGRTLSMILAPQKK